MGGKPIGTIFVELDLDPERYTKGQQKLLKDAQSTTLNIEQNFKNLGIKSAAEMDLMRAKIKNSFDMIANSSKATANDIIRAEEAKNSKLKALNDQQFGAQTGIIDKLKNNWLAASAAAASAMILIHKGMAYIEAGAKAMQVESAFKIMADSAGVNSERMIESMKKATRETIDDSAMMQKAIKLMTLGYNPEQIERFSQVVITASQIAGTTAAVAYDELADAIGNRAPKALVRMGAVTREQMAIVSAAIEAGADSTVLYELAMSNLELKQKMLQGTQDQATIAMQRMKAMTDDATESIGKGLIIAIDKAFRGCEYLAAGVMGLAAAYASYRALVYKVMGDEKEEAKNRDYANWALKQKAEHLKNVTIGLIENAEAEERATGAEIAGAKDRVDAQMKVLKALVDEHKNKEKSEAANKKFWEDYKKEVEGVFEFEKQKLDDQLKEFDKYVHDKNALNVWYAAASRKIVQKEVFDQITIFEDAKEEFEKAKAKPSRMEQWYIDKNKPSWFNSKVEEEDQMRGFRIKAWQDENDKYLQITQHTAEAVQDAWSDFFFDAFTGKLKSLQDYFAAFYQSIAKMASQYLSQQAMGGLSGLLGKTGSPITLGDRWGSMFEKNVPVYAGGGSAKGNIFDPNGMMAFARGGVVNEPMVFPFARGTGLMGEAGPEAIMPLSRNSSGELGVKASGSGGGTTVIVNNYTGQQVETKETRGPGGTRSLEIMIGQALTKDGPASRALQSTYGISRKGAMRG